MQKVQKALIRAFEGIFDGSFFSEQWYREYVGNIIDESHKNKKSKFNGCLDNQICIKKISCLISKFKHKKLLKDGIDGSDLLTARDETQVYGYDYGRN